MCVLVSGRLSRFVTRISKTNFKNAPVSFAVLDVFEDLALFSFLGLKGFILQVSKFAVVYNTCGIIPQGIISWKSNIGTNKFSLFYEETTFRKRLMF